MSEDVQHERGRAALARCAALVRIFIISGDMQH